MKRIIFAVGLGLGVVSGSLIYSNSLKPADSSSLPAFNPALINSVPTVTIPSNKQKDKASFALPTQRELSNMMTEGAKQHVKSITMINLGDYEKTRGRKTLAVSTERQVWAVKEQYAKGEDYQGLHGKFKGATVTTIVDAETGSPMSQDIDYQKGHYTPTSAPAPLN